MLLCLFSGSSVGLLAQEQTFEVAFLLESDVQSAHLRIDEGLPMPLPLTLSMASGDHHFDVLVHGLETSFNTNIRTDQSFRVNRQGAAYLCMGSGHSRRFHKQVTEYTVKYRDQVKEIHVGGWEDYDNFRMRPTKNETLNLTAPGFKDQNVHIVPFGSYLIRPNFEEDESFMLLEKANMRKRAFVKIGISALISAWGGHMMLNGTENRSQELYDRYHDAINPKLVREAYTAYEREVQRVNRHQVQYGSVGVVGALVMGWSLANLQVELNVLQSNSLASNSGSSEEGPQSTPTRMEVDLSWLF